MLIKICGIKLEEEVMFLNEIKPDYIGLVFAESKRKISIEQGKRLLSLLSPNITPVAVFRNNSLEEILSVVNSLNINVVQLHGEESYELVQYLKNMDLTLWKGVCINGREENQDLSYFERVIYDSSSPGSGQELKLEGFNPKNEFLLSGGLTPINIVEKLSLKNLIGVDVSSGVESIEKGERKKDYKRCKEFVERVREYERNKGKV